MPSKRTMALLNRSPRIFLPKRMHDRRPPRTSNIPPRSTSEISFNGAPRARVASSSTPSIRLVLPDPFLPSRTVNGSNRLSSARAISVRRARRPVALERAPDSPEVGSGGAVSELRWSRPPTASTATSSAPLQAVLTAVAGLLEADDRRLGGDVETVVDVYGAGLNPVGHAHGLCHVPAPDVRSQAEDGTVGRSAPAARESLAAPPPSRRWMQSLKGRLRTKEQPREDRRGTPMPDPLLSRGDDRGHVCTPRIEGGVPCCTPPQGRPRRRCSRSSIATGRLGRHRPRRRRLGTPGPWARCMVPTALVPRRLLARHGRGPAVPRGRRRCRPAGLPIAGRTR